MIGAELECVKEAGIFNISLLDSAFYIYNSPPLV
jgi:hypothetical protein